jgi:hypothetical protein
MQINTFLFMLLIVFPRGLFQCELLEKTDISKHQASYVERILDEDLKNKRKEKKRKEKKRKEKKRKEKKRKEKKRKEKKRKEKKRKEKKNKSRKFQCLLNT